MLQTSTLNSKVRYEIWEGCGERRRRRHRRVGVGVGIWRQLLFQVARWANIYYNLGFLSIMPCHIPLINCRVAMIDIMKVVYESFGSNEDAGVCGVVDNARALNLTARWVELIFYLL